RTALNQTTREVVLGKSLGQLPRECLVEPFESPVLVQQRGGVSEFLVDQAEPVVCFGHLRIERSGFLECIAGFFKATQTKARKAETVVSFRGVRVEFYRLFESFDSLAILLYFEKFVALDEQIVSCF